MKSKAIQQAHLWVQHNEALQKEIKNEKNNLQSSSGCCTRVTKCFRS
ncbi:hypothetical protein IFVP177_C2150049 [Vibrio parahaemolyticus]